MIRPMLLQANISLLPLLLQAIRTDDHARYYCRPTTSTIWPLQLQANISLLPLLLQAIRTDDHAHYYCRPTTSTIRPLQLQANISLRPLLLQSIRTDDHARCYCRPTTKCPAAATVGCFRQSSLGCCNCRPLTTSPPAAATLQAAHLVRPLSTSTASTMTAKLLRQQRLGYKDDGHYYNDVRLLRRRLATIRQATRTTIQLSATPNWSLPIFFVFFLPIFLNTNHADHGSGGAL